MSSLGPLLLTVAASAGTGGAIAAGGFAKLRAAQVAVVAMAMAMIAASVRLTWAIASLDYSFVYVAQQTRADSSVAYRIAGLWGGAEGSLLFFATLLGVVCAWTVVRGLVGRNGLIGGAVIVAALCVTVLAFADPFARSSLPAIRGAGLTPILEHPAMLYHPPILYAGLVATLVAFLIVLDDPGRATGERIDAVRRSTIMAWTLLVAGLATGANWAYVEVGWGGYWAWDPVENTVLMPWLLLTAGIHGLRSDSWRKQFPRAVQALVAAPFVFVLFGAAVTRSGGLSSVHAFAEARALGWSLGLITTVATVVLLVRVVSGRATESDSPSTPTGDRLLAVSMVLALFSVMFVLLGVGVPLLPGSNRIVTAEYYNRIGVPVLLVTLSALAMMSRPWQGRERDTIARVTWLVAGAAASLAVALAIGVDGWLMLVVSALVGAVVVAHVLAGRGTRPASLLAHIGFVIFAVGAVASADAEVFRRTLEPGESMSIGSNQEFIYNSYAVTTGPRPDAEAITMYASIIDTTSGRTIVSVSPGLVNYPNRAVVLAETALHSTPQRDIQVVVTTLTADGLAAVSVSERPGQMLVWWGAAVVTLAGLVALIRPRRNLAGGSRD